MNLGFYSFINVKQNYLWLKMISEKNLRETSRLEWYRSYILFISNINLFWYTYVIINVYTLWRRENIKYPPMFCNNASRIVNIEISGNLCFKMKRSNIRICRWTMWYAVLNPRHENNRTNEKSDRLTRLRVSPMKNINSRNGTFWKMTSRTNGDIRYARRIWWTLIRAAL